MTLYCSMDVALDITLLAAVIRVCFLTPWAVYRLPRTFQSFPAPATSPSIP